ncbi:hypothetical protein HYN51_14320 [Limnobaculum parvum]|uniref:Chitinase n=2 Tax=Limnobaculum parvum TaxID=2172103 RepID=A0A2Y9U1D3_9GAMM|nr:hypothetical protein HYN51_14320 [Limnobaculum parvum]
MSTLAPVNKWSLFLKEGPDKANPTNTPNRNETPAEVKPGKIIQEPAIYYQRQANATGGFYPMGVHGIWHGGIHFDYGSELQWAMSLYNLADGEVVATRINNEYVSVNVDEPQVLFSSSFALIRHRLELPPEPPAEKETKPEETPAPATQPAQAPVPATPDSNNAPAETPASPTEPPAATPEPRPSMTFYSLFMHMLPWKMYQQEGLKLPAFWGKSQYQIKADKKNDALIGIRMRPLKAGVTKDINNKSVLCVIARGSIIRVGDALTTKPKYKKVEEIVSGAAYPAWDGTTEGYVFTNDLEAVPGETDLWFVGVKSKDPHEETVLKTVKGQNIRETADATSKILAVLLPDKKVTLGEATGSRSKLKGLESADSTVPPLKADAEGNLPGWLSTADLEVVATVPEKLDQIQILESPVPIKAGEMVGYPGTDNLKVEAGYGCHGYPILHLEFFSGDNVPEFMVKSREFAGRLPDNQKSLLKVDKGTRLTQPSASDTEIPAGCDVEPESDSPKDSGWLKVKIFYLVKVLDRSTELGAYTAAKKQYAINKDQQKAIADSVSLDATKMPASVKLIEELEENDKKARLIGFSPTDAQPCWVAKGGLNERGRRTDTASALPAWKSFPLKEVTAESPVTGFMRVLPLSQIKKEDKVSEGQTIWWRIESGNEQGEDISGWVKEGGTVTRCSPWSWPGFELIEEQSQPSEQAAAKELNHGDPASEEGTKKEVNLRAQANQADRGELLQKLHEIIDGQGEKDDRLMVYEYQKALSKPWLAEQMARLVVKYESEWYADEGLSKWEALFNVLDPENKDAKHWENEREKIKALIWYKDVAGKLGLPEDGRVWHFHPVGVVDLMLADRSCRCVQELTIDLLKSLSVSERNANKYLSHFNESFVTYDVDTCLRKGHFLSQLLTESGYLQYTKELGNDLSYDPWRGRGLIQITFKDNYKEYGDYINEDVTSGTNYIKLESEPHSITSAIWYWNVKAILTPHADNDDFIWITRKINGGYNGYDHRLSVLNKFIEKTNGALCFKKNHSGIYYIEESQAYNEMRGIFAWGLWNDPEGNKSGISEKSKVEALKGYRRYISLHDAAGKPEQKGKWYGYSDAREHSENRILELSK